MEGKESLERLFAQLSDEQKEQFRNCQNMDEIMKLANEEKVELSEEQIDFLTSGGCGCGDCYTQYCTRYTACPKQCPMHKYKCPVHD